MPIDQTPPKVIILDNRLLGAGVFEPPLEWEESMSMSSKPNIGAAMVHVHKAITRGLDVSGERSEAFVQEGYPDAATREGFVIYARTLGWVLNAHHLGEDEVAFPY